MTIEGSVPSFPNGKMFMINSFNIKKGLEILDNPNHHKMMRKELTMNIFPFGNDGTDPRIIIKLVRYEIIIFEIQNNRIFY